MDYREIKRLGDDPQAARALADILLTHRANVLADGTQDFLASLKRQGDNKPYSMRQLEALLSIRDSSTVSTKVGPYKLVTLVAKAWERRGELADSDDEEWLATLCKRDLARGLTEGERRRLVALCKDPGIDLIPADEWIDLKDRRI